MIEANQLRIGNWVFIDNGERPKYAYDISAHDIEEIEGCGTDTFPIPLTPEILEQCGFEWETKNKKHLQIWPKDKSFHICFYVPDMTFQIIETDMPEMVSLGSDVKYLHQLQNLYFALTNEELILQSIK